MADEYDIGKAFAAIEDELIASVIRNLKRHRAEEDDLGINWSQWQVEQLRALEKYKKENRAKYGDKFEDLNKKIEDLIRIANKDGSMDQEIAILEAIKNGFPATKAAAGATAEFFKLNDRKLEALIKATTDDMQRAETAVLRMADDQYRKVIYNAQVYANTGAGTYEKAVDMATKDFLSAGLNCIEYKNGARHTLADYAEMAIRTANKRAYLQGEGTKRQEWGITTVKVNKRGNPCPKCLPFVGKVLIDDVWGGGSKDGKSPVTGIKYPLLSKAISAGLYHPRCKDAHTTYFEGISTPPEGSKYTADELDKIAEDYQKEQQQQHAKRQKEKFGRLAKYSLDLGNQEKYERKEKEWEHARFKAGGVDSREYAYTKSSPVNFENQAKSVAKDVDSAIMDLTHSELGALMRYKSFESYALNESLRNAESLDDIGETQKKLVNKLDSALSKLPKYEGDLLRTVDFSDWSDAEEQTERFMEAYIPGKSIRIKQYWSTSKATGYNDDARIKIYIQGAKKGRDISSVGLDENEVLYERGTVFDVISKVFQNGIWHILMEEV